MSGLPVERLYPNAFELHDTHGVPLGAQLLIAERIGVGIDVPKFYREAVLHGWTPGKALAVVAEALSDAGKARDYIDAAIGFLAVRDGR